MVEMEREPAWRAGLVEGVGWGLVLAVFAAVFSVLGLTPSLAWIPEVPLLGAGALVPLVVLAMAGSRAGSRSGQIAGGWLAGAVAGAIGGMAGGLCYVAYGKPVLNVAVGLLAGAAGGAVIGGLAVLATRRERR
jgi:hypothetical protein